MKNIREGFNRRCELLEEIISEFVDRTVDMTKSEHREKRMKKTEQNLRDARHHHVDQYVHCGHLRSRERKKGRKNM